MLRGFAWDLPPVLAVLFVVYAMLGVGMMAVLVPPFCNADETAHFLRADQVASGVLVAARPAGRVDLGIAEAASPCDAVRGRADAKLGRVMLDAAGRAGWGRVGEAAFPNTALYPPTGYLAAAAAILAGQGLGWPIATTLVAARLVNGAVCILACAAAIALSGPLAPLLFTLLCLPMSLSLFATVSQDGVLIAAAALAAGLVGGCAAGWRVWVLCACLCVAGMGRPPYAVLAAVVLVSNTPGWQRRLAAAAGIVGVVLAWSVWCAGPVASAIRWNKGVDPAGQLAWLLGHKALLYQVPVVVLAHQWADGLPYARQFVGVLGALDVSLPGPYYAVAWVMIGVALVVARPGDVTPWGRIVVLGALGAGCVGVFAVQYFTWTEVGSHVVEGVQGRYFLPLALFAPFVLPGRIAGRWARLACVPVMAFPAISLALAVRAVMHRYYL